MLSIFSSHQTLLATTGKPQHSYGFPRQSAQRKSSHLGAGKRQFLLPKANNGGNPLRVNPSPLGEATPTRAPDAYGKSCGQAAPTRSVWAIERETLLQH